MIDATSMRKLAFVGGLGCLSVVPCGNVRAEEPSAERVYENRLTRLTNPRPILADYPEFIEPVRERTRYEAPVLVDDSDADLEVRAEDSVVA